MHQNQGYPLSWTRIKMGYSAGICVRGIIVSNIYTILLRNSSNPMAWTPVAMLMIPSYM